MDLRDLPLKLLKGLWFLPAAIVVLFIALALVLVELDERTSLSSGVVFGGDASAARTVLSVIAGSLITVAGLTLSVTIVVLELTSSQFSPRILRTFFGDRVTQVTVGAFVGIFVYSLLVLRSVGGGPESASVPRLSVTVASGLAIAAVVLLVVFIHHVSQLIQVSHVMAQIARETLGRLDALYPNPYGRPVDEVDVEAVIGEWSAEKPGLVLPREPGFVARIHLDELARLLPNGVDRAAVLARPGDFVSIEEPLVAVWPASAGAACESAVHRTFRVERERDLDQDVGFGLRQLVDTAVKAMSPGINDPTTACTCIGYVRSILACLTVREFPEQLRRGSDRDLTILVRRREFEEYLDSVAEIGRYSYDDVRVTVALLETLRSICEIASESDIGARATAAVDVAQDVGARASEAASNARDRERITRLVDSISRRWGSPVPSS